MELKRIRIGQIGLGHNHGEAKMIDFRRFPELYDVVGWAEDDESWVEKRGKKPGYEGLPRLDIDELLDKCDAILVETDVPRLTRTAQMCLDAGKHIHLDKPGSVDCPESLARFKTMLDTAERKGLTVQMGYMYRCNPAIRWCMDKVRSGELGEITSINAEMSTCHEKSYREWLTGFPGGIMYILGCHLIDLSVSVLGEPLRVTPFLKHTGKDGIDFPDNDLAVLEYERALARIFVSSVEVNGYGRRQFVVSGTEGTVAIMPIEHTLAVTYAHTSMGGRTYQDCHEVVEIPDVPKGGRYLEMAKDFYDYVNGIKENPYTYEHEYIVQKTLMRAIGQ